MDGALGVPGPERDAHRVHAAPMRAVWSTVCHEPPNAAGPGTATELDVTSHAATDTARAALRRWVLVVAILRYAIPIAAIPLAPVLIPDRVGLLVLLRPSKEVLLLGGGLHRTQGDPALATMLVAYAPLMVAAVWVFFWLGRLYRDDLVAGRGPAWLSRMIPDETFAVARRVLDRRGPAIAVLGRLATLPPTALAAAAGTSDVDTRRYLVADTVGALASFALLVGVGAALGRAYERGGPWLTAAGLALLVGLLALLTRWVRREGERNPA